MKKYATLTLIVSVFSFHCFAQDVTQSRSQRKLTESDALFNNFSYSKSIEGYKEVLKHDGGNINVMLKIAEAYTKLHNTKAAMFWYSDALSPVENRTKVANDYFFEYAEVLAENKKYDEALKWYQLYKESEPGDKRAVRKIETINNRDALYADSIHYEIKTLDINSPFSDFAPAFYYDSGIIFSSAREEVAKRKRYNYTNSAFLDLYISRFQDSVLLYADKFSYSLTSKFHEGAVAFYDNYKKMIFTRNVEDTTAAVLDPDGTAPDKELILQLFYSERGEGNEWLPPVPLSINQQLYSMGHPTVSKDGKTLYFSSNIPGGYGGTDLYVSRWVNNDWSHPQNLGPDINTTRNEMFPFIHQDTTLYFSSTGHGGLGGLDIFWVALNGDYKVMNIGYPLNTQNDDFSIVLDEQGKMGYFASNRVREDDDDIYQFFVKEPPVKIEEPLPVEKVEPKPEIVVEVREKEIYYTVQILALINPQIVHKAFLKNLKGVLKYDGVDGFHRYTYGTYSTAEEAELILALIRLEGYKDAFIRKVERYKELSKAPGMDVETARKKE
jgi:tetratricopeptide (TPR) repeat protein